jgi:hypothetical protein
MLLSEDVVLLIVLPFCIVLILTLIIVHSTNRIKCSINCSPVSLVPDDDFDVLFAIMQSAMQGMYERSHWGWSSATKRAEMKEPDMLFLIARSLQVCMCRGT